MAWNGLDRAIVACSGPIAGIVRVGHAAKGCGDHRQCRCAQVEFLVVQPGELFSGGTGLRQVAAVVADGMLKDPPADAPGQCPRWLSRFSSAALRTISCAFFMAIRLSAKGARAIPYSVTMPAISRFGVTSNAGLNAGASGGAIGRGGQVDIADLL